MPLAADRYFINQIRIHNFNFNFNFNITRKLGTSKLAELIYWAEGVGGAREEAAGEAREEARERAVTAAGSSHRLHLNGRRSPCLVISARPNDPVPPPLLSVAGEAEAAV